MGAGPPKYNKNAEKYDEAAAFKIFNDSIKMARELKQGEYTYDFIGEIARKLNIYHDLYFHLCKRFESLKPLYTELKQILEANCYTNAKKGKIKEATAIVNLKSNHHWTDRQETNNNTAVTINWEETKNYTPDDKSDIA